MVSVIADVLKSKLAALEWIDRFGGLVSNATRPELITGADGAQVVKGIKAIRLPVKPVTRHVGMMGFINTLSRTAKRRQSLFSLTTAELLSSRYKGQRTPGFNSTLI